MIFPQYNYKNFHNGNKEEWALQPPTQENWNKMVNDSYLYCKELKDLFEFEGICKDYELPSFHPYWKLQTFKSTIELIEQTRGLIAQTQRYIDNNGYYVFNAQKSISIQKEAIKNYCNKLNFR